MVKLPPLTKIRDLGDGRTFKIHHWGHDRIASLFRLRPEILAEYYPETARRLSSAGTSKKLLSTYLNWLVRDCTPLKLRAIDQGAARTGRNVLGLAGVYIDLELTLRLPKIRSLQCGNGACAVAAFDMEPSCLEVPSPRTRRSESGKSLRSSPQSKTLPRSSKSRQIPQAPQPSSRRSGAMAGRVGGSGAPPMKKVHGHDSRIRNRFPDALSKP
ncbi:MAG: hypothetical protein O2960_02050 [Verrucomicrobia bacterium]|nr:hypothetical protein [Verrucomicrobiota bacterium]